MAGGLEGFRSSGDTRKQIETLITQAEALNPTALLKFKVSNSLAGILSGLSPDDIIEACSTATNAPRLRKQNGAIHTPLQLAAAVTRHAAEQWSRLHGANLPKSIADLSCGSGVFLYSARQVFGPSPDILGVDIDHRSIVAAHIAAKITRQKWRLVEGDSLFPDHATDLFQHSAALKVGKEFDLILGNPPFVRSPILDKNYVQALRNTYETIPSSSFDLSIAFLEAGLKSLAPGGVLSYVITSKFTSGSYGQKICRLIGHHYRTLSIHNFGDAQLFPGYTAYTMIITITRAKPAKRFFLYTPFRASLSHGLIDDGEVRTLPSEILKSHPWEISSGDGARILRKINSEKNAFLSDVFPSIFQGIRTGANDAFVVDDKIGASLERELLLPFVSGRELKRFVANLGRQYLIFPYEIDQIGSIQPISEQNLIKNYPNTYKHLISYKQLLRERDVEKGSPWYSFSRSQNLSGYLRPKIFVKEMMPTAEFAVDLKGTVAFGSGYALDASHLSTDQIRIWAVVLSTPTMEFVLRNCGTQLHSGWFRMLKQHLKNVKLPQFSAKQQSDLAFFAAKCFKQPGKSSAILGKVDEIVSKAFGLTVREREFITQYLSEHHLRSKATRTFPKERPSAQGKNLLSTSKYEPVVLPEYFPLHRERFDLRHASTFKPNKQLPIHRWYSYTQGFSAGLVETLIGDFSLSKNKIVLDPFMGCGTTNLVCSLMDIASVGMDVSPLMAWVATVKTSLLVPDQLKSALERISLPDPMKRELPQQFSLLPFRNYFEKAYSPNILSQVLEINAFLADLNFSNDVNNFFRLGFISLLEEISKIRKHGSHYRFLDNSHSVGLNKLNIPILSDTTDIRSLIESRWESMLLDLRSAGIKLERSVNSKPRILCDDIRTTTLLAPNSIDAVITSPPYLNRNNYLAQQKAELSLLKLVGSREEYERIVDRSFRSHVDGTLSKGKKSIVPEVNEIVDRIELEPGNNAKIPDMIVGYFDDLHYTLANLFPIMKRGGLLAFVVGNTRWGGIVVPIDHLLLKIAERIGFSPKKLLVTRLKGNSPQQMRRFGRIPMRESIVIFQK